MKSFLVAATLLMSFTWSFQAQAVRVVASEEAVTETGVVEKTKDDDEGVVVMLKGKGGAYYLKRTHSHFDQVLKKIRAAEKSGKPLSVTADKKELNIVDVK